MSKWSLASLFLLVSACGVSDEIAGGSGTIHWQANAEADGVHVTIAGDFGTATAVVDGPQLVLEIAPPAGQPTPDSFYIDGRDPTLRPGSGLNFGPAYIIRAPDASADFDITSDIAIADGEVAQQSLSNADIDGLNSLDLSTEDELEHAVLRVADALK